MRRELVSFGLPEAVVVIKVARNRIDEREV